MARETNMKRLRILTVLALTLPLIAGIGARATAQDYPTKPLRIIVTWNAGGTTDITARLFGPELTRELGQPVAVINRAGGGGALGTKEVLDAPKDGYTLLMTTSGNHILTPLAKDVGYTEADFTPIGQLSSRTLVLAVRADAPWKTLAALQKDAKANPGKYTFGAVPNGMPFLTLSAWANAAGVELVHVPQQGGAPGVTGTLGGHLNMVPESLSSVLSHINSGTMRALAIFNKERDPAAPVLPTAAEQSFKVFGNPFTGIAVAKGTPQPIVDKLAQVTAKIANDPAFQEKMKKAGDVVSYLDAKAFGEIWKRDWETYKPILSK
jgi:tripartite-type tricarboxylate transporter receptor subunit TctC